MLFFNAQNSARGTEEFRTLRSRLDRLRAQRPLRTLLITSSLPKEGKTFVAANLAQAIGRQPEKHALLIDADLRAPRAHMALGAPLTPGLSDYLRGEADELAILQRGPRGNLFFIPGGKPASHPAELIANGRLKALLDRLAPIFDWVILDSPPIVPVSDAGLLADLCDGVLMIVRAGATPFDLAQKATKEFRSKRLLGVVLNHVKPGSSYSSYYYDHYLPNAKDGKGQS
jgi:capsular exopolysaccharide synthesis family protein